MQPSMANLTMHLKAQFYRILVLPPILALIEKEATGRTTDSGSSATTDAAAAAPAAPAAEGPEATPRGTSGESSTSSPAGPGSPTTSQGTPGEPNGQGAAGKDGKHEGGGGGNDDPPPLNPPKPKPNPNPDQSGSSGSFSDADVADGVSGGEGTGGGAGAGSSGPGSTGHQNPGSSDPDSTDHGTDNTRGDGGSWGLNLELPKPNGNFGGSYGTGPTPDPHDTSSSTPKEGGPLAPDLTDTVLTATTPVLFFLSAVIVALLGYSVWQYFAYLGQKRRRTYRTVRDVPSPPLDEDILDHLQRGEPPPDYGYTMVTPRRRDKFAARRRRPPRVNRRTIIELHLEVLHECEAPEWENVKHDYLHILVEQFMRGHNGHSSFPNAPSTNQALSRNNVASTLDPPTDIDGIDPCPPHDPDPWRCMDNIQLAADPSASNEDDRWKCMQSIQLDAEQSRAHSNPGDATLDCIHWINWIDRNKHLLQECTTQPWFLQLKADWKQYYQQHATHDVSGHSEHCEHGHIPSADMTKLRLWKEWVAQQHRQLRTYSEQEWFKHLLNNVQEETLPQQGDVPRVETDLEVEHVMTAEDLLRVRDTPRSQLHPLLYLHKPLCAKTWILILALVIEQCELERSLQARELYVDDLLEKL
ncbi:CD99 antigen [Plasmodium fragile]|uniref:CD99 antigen n=1 Tax=Plasmodium fragile TaxID=5857 RepID=A0A0D9QF24_PLAFR|nr:CD99 antigen [Plasmodium fragile]KJP85432.1 CD99 antigen [Plasmodium fragile]